MNTSYIIRLCITKAVVSILLFVQFSQYTVAEMRSDILPAHYQLIERTSRCSTLEEYIDKIDGFYYVLLGIKPLSLFDDVHEITYDSAKYKTVDDYVDASFNYVQNKFVNMLYDLDMEESFPLKIVECPDGAAPGINKIVHSVICTDCDKYIWTSECSSSDILCKEDGHKHVVLLYVGVENTDAVIERAEYVKIYEPTVDLFAEKLSFRDTGIKLGYPLVACRNFEDRVLPVASICLDTNYKWNMPKATDLPEDSFTDNQLDIMILNASGAICMHPESAALLSKHFKIDEDFFYLIVKQSITQAYLERLTGSLKNSGVNTVENIQLLTAVLKDVSRYEGSTFNFRAMNAIISTTPDFIMGRITLG